MAFGYQFLSASGVSKLEPDETFCRVVAIFEIPDGASGTVNIPEFDDTLGIFTVSFADIGNLSPIIPSLSWNNDTHILTYSPLAMPWGQTTGRCWVTFIHYR